jgi:hypothetical protein
MRFGERRRLGHADRAIGDHAGLVFDLGRSLARREG